MLYLVLGRWLRNRSDGRAALIKWVPKFALLLTVLCVVSVVGIFVGGWHTFVRTAGDVFSSDNDLRRSAWLVLGSWGTVLFGALSIAGVFVGVENAARRAELDVRDARDRAAAAQAAQNAAPGDGDIHPVGVEDVVRPTEPDTATGTG